MIRTVVLAIPFLFAAAPPGTDPNSALSKWFEAQHSIGGISCCGMGDGHIISEDDVRIRNSQYQVLIAGVWWPVGSDRMRDPAGGPNPTDHPVVWYRLVFSDSGDPVVQIFCFSPGYQL